MFSQVCVKNSVHREGGGVHPPWQTTPLGRQPPCKHENWYLLFMSCKQILHLFSLPIFLYLTVINIIRRPARKYPVTVPFDALNEA